MSVYLFILILWTGAFGCVGSFLSCPDIMSMAESVYVTGKVRCMDNVDITQAMLTLTR